ncbi:MAG: NYN domain-containing protein [Candidatus Eisenbacteria bacterium]|nr:NYN domain-containing protein [Candidatus Eisenbacteria bacterium]
MTRTAFLVDGFNLYHSLLAARDALGGAGTRWLDLRALCSSFLYRIGGGAELVEVTYFSALAHHLDGKSPATTKRHRLYMECLRDSGIRIQLGHFKRATLRCPECGTKVPRHEEKETDVAIGVSLMQKFARDECDVAVIITGDSDQVPAVRAALDVFPSGRVFVCFPFDRVSDELRQVASGHFRIGAGQYANHQLPNPVVTHDGEIIRKPEGW